MRRFVAGMVFLALLAAGSLLSQASPVRAQDACAKEPGRSGFERAAYEVDEAGGYVDLPVWADNAVRWGHGEIDYETFALSAIAGQDFQHSSGTLTYTTEGSHDIRVPITHDDLVEGREQFEVRLTNFRGSFSRGGCETTVVTILDEHPEQSSDSPGAPDGSNEQAAASQTATPARPPSPWSLPSAVPASGSADLSDPSAAADELQPGSGFELTSEANPEPAAGRGGGGSASWLPLGLGAIALGSGGVVWVRQRRRWSPTRS